jgi:hypothetical protein
MFNPLRGSTHIVRRFLSDSPIKKKFDLFVNRTTLSFGKFSDFGFQFGGYSYEQTNSLFSFGVRHHANVRTSRLTGDSNVISY